MQDKSAIVVGAGLALMIAISVWVVSANNESSAALLKTANTINALTIQQKNREIKKLKAQLVEAQKELESLKGAPQIPAQPPAQPAKN
jgi:peptidoglycan hydrolase CwlO-like protein